MTIGNKLIASSGAMLTVLLALGASSLYSTENLADDVYTAAAVTAHKLHLAGELSRDVAEMAAARNAAILGAAMGETAGLSEIAALVEERQKGIEKTLAEITPLLTAGREKTAADALRAGLPAWTRTLRDTLRLCGEGKAQEANTLQKANRDGSLEMSRAAAEILETGRELVAESISDAAYDRARNRWMLGLALGVTLLIGAGALALVLQINRALRKVAAEVSAGAAQVASAAAQVGGASQSLAQGSSQQAASLEETSASTEEINSMAQKNTENSRSAADLMAQSQRKVEETNRSLEGMVAAMNEINASSDKISRIIRTIDEIAFQTNILALNAAVEAARAGEAGMGFAVVADEVRNLAQRCAAAARDTAGLIDESLTKSKDGKSKVDEVAVAIRTVTEEAGRVRTLVDEVNLGSQEQARGIEQIAKAVAQMEQVTQKTAAGAEESASAAGQLNSQAEVLTGIVNRLTALVGQG